MNRRMVKLAACVTVAAAVAIGFAAAAEFTDNQVFQNSFSTSGVKVQVQQMRLDQGELKPVQEGMEISPGVKESFIPKVSCLKEDCYVRVRFEIREEGIEQGFITEEEFYGLGGDWIRKGNYYYCRKRLEKGESSEVIQGIEIPADLKKRGGSFSITTVAEAIQAKNLQPDFAGSSPWGTVEVQAAAEREELGTASVVRSVSPDFTYLEEGTFECSTEDLFSGFDTFQPGDTCSETLLMKNSTKKTMTVFFRTENLETDLLREMTLTISSCGEKIYSGNLASAELESFLPIASIESGRSGNLKFAIRMPEDADNSYSLLKDHVTWILAISESDASEGTVAWEKSSDTGEQLQDLLICLVILAVLAAVIAAIVVIRRGRPGVSGKKFRSGKSRKGDKNA